MIKSSTMRQMHINIPGKNYYIINLTIIIYIHYIMLYYRIFLYVLRVIIILYILYSNYNINIIVFYILTNRYLI